MPAYEHAKRRVAEVLDIPSAPDDALGRWFDRFIVALIALNVVVVVLESVDALHDRYAAWFRGFEAFSLAVFLTEYVLRVWSITAKPEYAHPVKGRLRFATTPFAIIDLLAIAPAFFP
ncbi:MAG TPA: ion transporter, partial [Candidatus Thermoplasmatota archaeon]|nr:ion transporter [Candidatus Thermoplasmatota archaeon]